ncbi:MAG TPA: TetR/AcrR family transcriptional regulator, partial [Pseudonocardia sp.]|uniref:TetR/AcrR family transcriptional regulator n=1 Tax=Pseudonocardia sp. TaxID=60912 RepID=UPI002C84455C
MADTKSRILTKTGELFRRNGYVGTGLKQIATEADAPFGSIYHFFPGGKQQLAAEVIRAAGRMYQARVAEVLNQGTDPA